MKIQSVKYNFMMNSLLNISTILFPLISYPYVSRVLGPTYLGMIAFSESIIAYFTMIADLGIPTYGLKMVAMNRENETLLNKLINDILKINLLTCIISYILFAFALLFVQSFEEVRALLIVMAPGMLLKTLGVEWLYKGLEQYSYITKRSVAFKLLSIGLILLLIKSPENIVLYGFLVVFSSFGSNILNFYRLKKLFKLNLKGNVNIRDHFKYIFVFLGINVATIVYTNLDNVMLGAMSSTLIVGYYNCATKVKKLLFGVVTSLSSVLLPRVSNYIKNDNKGCFETLALKSWRFIVCISLPLTIFFIIFSEPVIQILSGDEFFPSVLAMQIITPTVFFIGLSNLIGIQFLIPMGKEKLVFNSVCMGAVVDILINLLLIEDYGAAGAAIGTLVAEIVVLMYQMYVLGNLSIFLLKNTSWLKYILAIILCSLVTIFVYNQCDFMTSILLMLLSGGVFFLLYFSILLILQESICVEIFYIVRNYCKRLLGDR